MSIYIYIYIYIGSYSTICIGSHSTYIHIYIGSHIFTEHHVPIYWLRKISIHAYCHQAPVGAIAIDCHARGVLYKVMYRHTHYNLVVYLLILLLLIAATNVVLANIVPLGSLHYKAENHYTGK